MMSSLIENKESAKISSKKSQAFHLSQISPARNIISLEQNLLEASTDQSPPPSQEDEFISLIYKPVITVIRLAGVCPIRIEKMTIGISYTFSWFSNVTIASYSLSSLVICFYLSWIGALSPLKYILRFESARNETKTNFVDDTSNSSFKDCDGLKSIMMPFLQKILPLQLPINTSINVIASLTSIPKFAQLLSAWSKFENKFKCKFRVKKSPFAGLIRARNRLVLFYCLFGGIYCTLVIYVTRPKCIATKNVCPVWRQVVGTVVVLPYTMYTFMEDFKFLFMFRTLEEGFRQISIKIQEYNEQEVKAELLHQGNLEDFVSKWHELLLDIRQQVRMVSECSSFHHVVSISTTFFSLLVGIFFSVVFQFTSTMDKEKGDLALVALGFCAVGFMRCFVKTNGSERILNEEKNAANQLSNVKTGDDLKTRIKINSLVDLIGREPAQITILNCFKLNTSFLFQIIGQIATYLIVFLQFDKM